ncbi:L,D-transpeptidase family protein [Shimia sp. CNT1-13L.2]|uniref:L,D-transpeptidase family protein n=1 Tax=Shimia sp. CNT1-13L.2 TaxID=2959663 RepID=UPI0020CB7E02|nr:L,D-transpeptidase family protein [Shimia sp. CNT1-13L.2]MCP9482185.1 L,D-transpeptidase family protein [Shimia sp. CNT1-13L.2]
MLLSFHSLRRHFVIAGFVLAAHGGLLATPAQAELTAFKQAVAETAARDADIAKFYRENGYRPIWTGTDADDLERRLALLQALENADEHGLPTARYDFNALYQQLSEAKTPRDLGKLEVALAKAYLGYARDVQTGMFVPSKLDEGIVRKAPVRDRGLYLSELLISDPTDYIRALPPTTPEYNRLMKEKLRLEREAARGGWGPKVKAKKLEPGDKGNAVVALRNRLIALGYLQRSAAGTFNSEMEKAVQAFQIDHGLESDGVAGASTIAEVNRTPVERLKSVIVAMERERWLNKPRGERHVMVNLTDFKAKIIDDGKVTFETRSVVGKNQHDRRSPEFSDVMEHMVINPTWNVPRSIATKEYLPMLKKNPNAVSYLKLIDSRGKVVNRGAVDFTQFSANTFPFDIKQPPSKSNALGLVKFMFPNRHNIYLHDTPAKSLFAREVRAFSHGCIRLHQPFDFAYALLAVQQDNPKPYFHKILKTGRETQVDLKKHVPVHIIYRTAFTNAKGPVQYRRDVYGRDAKIWQAMANEGVVLRTVQG